MYDHAGHLTLEMLMLQCEEVVGNGMSRDLEEIRSSWSCSNVMHV